MFKRVGEGVGGGQKFEWERVRRESSWWWGRMLNIQQARDELVSISLFLSLQRGAAQLESRKFLHLLYQLAARMSARSLATDPFQQTLQEVHTSTIHQLYSLNQTSVVLYVFYKLRCICSS